MSPIGCQPELQVAKTIFVTEVDAGLSFSLVEYVDGRLDIFRNGAAISPSPWPANEVASCVNAFQKISRLATAAAAVAERDEAGRR